LEQRGTLRGKGMSGVKRGKDQGIESVPLLFCSLSGREKDTKEKNQETSSGNSVFATHRRRKRIAGDIEAHWPAFWKGKPEPSGYCYRKYGGKEQRPRFIFSFCEGESRGGKAWERRKSKELYHPPKRRKK